MLACPTPGKAIGLSLHMISIHLERVIKITYNFNVTCDCDSCATQKYFGNITIKVGTLNLWTLFGCGGVEGKGKQNADGKWIERG